MKRLLVAVLLLGGCATPDSAQMGIEPGHWQDYHDMNRSIGMTAVENQDAPQTVKDRFAECFADYVVRAFTPAEMQKLDAYARGDATLTAGELKRLDEVSNSRANGSRLTNDSLSRFDTTCPNDVPDFQRYLRF